MNPPNISPTTFRRLLTRSVVWPPALLSALALVFLGQIMYLLSAAREVDHSSRVIAGANILMKLLVDGETGLRGYLITGDVVFLEPYNHEEGEVGPAVNGLTELVSAQPHQFERLRDIREAYADWRGYAREMIGLRAGGADYAPPVRNKEGKRRMDSMREQVAAFILIEEELRDARSRTVAWATWGVAGTSLALTLLLAGALAASTRRQLLGMSAVYSQVLAEREAQAETLRKSALRLEAVLEIDRAILAADSIPELTLSALRRMEKVVPSDGSQVVLFGSGAVADQVMSHGDLESPPATDACPQGLYDRDDPDIVADLAAVATRTPSQVRLFRAGHRSCMAVPLQAEGRQLGGLVLIAARPSAFTREHLRLTEEVSQQLSIAFQQAWQREQLRRNADELEQRVRERTRELQETLTRVKQLQGLLPICAWCKKVRDDKDYWHEVEHYVAAHTDARFSHGMCPACLRGKLEGLKGRHPKA